MKRTLVLKREPLAELTPTDLAGVAGGSHEPTPPQYVITHTCFDSNLVCWGPYLTQGSSCDYC